MLDPLPPYPDVLPDRDKFADEHNLIEELTQGLNLHADDRDCISQQAEAWITTLRRRQRPGLMERLFLTFPLASEGGRALMGLAEALLRVPDAQTRGELVEDKLARVRWQDYARTTPDRIGRLACAALSLAAALLRSPLRPLVRPLIRWVAERGLRALARLFVKGETLTAAQEAAKPETWHSFDMLGEAARTPQDAARYAKQYEAALDALIARVPAHAGSQGLSIKLSALTPRFEALQQDRALEMLVPCVLNLALKAKAAQIPLTIDAEEQDRLRLMLQVFARVFGDPRLSGWDGFGLVVQAYGKRAPAVIDWLAQRARAAGRQIPVRLVKGAYWDQEIKQAQVEGHADYPVYTTKTATDAAYLACAAKLLDQAPHLYPQFATHNAHTLAAVTAMGAGKAYELQRLHGMGAALHDLAIQEAGVPSRVYAPVGPHEDLLAYLVRRLLENGASASFVNQLYDPKIAAADLAADPLGQAPTCAIAPPAALFGPDRVNSQGWDLSEPSVLARLQAAQQLPLPKAESLSPAALTGSEASLVDPTWGTHLGNVLHLDAASVDRAVAAAQPWEVTAQARRQVLTRAADLYEAQTPALIATLTREAGKTLSDGVAEVREAVDFLRYYAEQIDPEALPRGLVAAISPWNFPLAIFTGQIAAALAAGNGVLAKPAETTPIIASQAVHLLHQAGVPHASLHLLQGRGAIVGGALSRNPAVQAFVFTGSTQTAQTLHRSMAKHLAPGTPLIAETGGQNAMILDSTALAEQSVPDILRSAFQSAGQRCSALRCLYVQEDVASRILTMIQGAMETLVIGDPGDPATDIGPLISAQAQADIRAYLEAPPGQILYQGAASSSGFFVPPTLIQVRSIKDTPREIFGPVLHVITYKSSELEQVLADIRKLGYGLTFGLATRLQSRMDQVTQGLPMGNIYINRDQIGAIVGSQPFGGEGLSGTGPKAGGPLYVPRLTRQSAKPPQTPLALPGPTGEINTYSLTSRGPILAAGPSSADQAAQVAEIKAQGGQVLAPQLPLSAEMIQALPSLSGVLHWGEGGHALAQALAARPGPLIPLITGRPDAAHVHYERHVCINTAAAGGNAELLGA